MSNHLKRKTRIITKTRTALDVCEVERIVNVTVHNTLTYMLWGMHEREGFGGKRLMRMIEHYNEVVENRNLNLFTPNDLRVTMLRECPEMKPLFETAQRETVRSEKGR